MMVVMVRRVNGRTGTRDRQLVRARVVKLIVKSHRVVSARPGDRTNHARRGGSST